MSITVNDPDLLAALRGAVGVVELRDPEGRVIGALSLEGEGQLPPGVKSPFTDQEMAERRKDRTGRPHADILRDLQARQ